MLKINNRCKVCQAVQKSQKLMNRIYKSSAYIPHSSDTLLQIWKDCQVQGTHMFTYKSLRMHVKNHQKISGGDYRQAMLRKKSKAAVKRIIDDRYEASNVQDAVINKGMELLDEGKISIKADHLLRAAKDKQDAQAKVRDQQLQLAEMVAFFTSGEDTYKAEGKDDRRKVAIDEYNPASPITEDPNTRSF